MHHHSCNVGEKHRNIDCFTDSMQGTSAAKRIHTDFSGELECMSMPYKKQRHGARTFWELIVILDPPADVPVFTLLTLLADLQSLLHLLRIGCLVAGKARPRHRFVGVHLLFFVFLRFLLARTAAPFTFAHSARHCKNRLMSAPLRTRLALMWKRSSCAFSSHRALRCILRRGGRSQVGKRIGN